MADEIDPDSSPDGDNADQRAPEHGLRAADRSTRSTGHNPLVLPVAVVVVGF
jgi:hypothetical protein